MNLEGVNEEKLGRLKIKSVITLLSYYIIEKIKISAMNGYYKDFSMWLVIDVIYVFSGSLKIYSFYENEDIESIR